MIHMEDIEIITTKKTTAIAIRETVKVGEIPQAMGLMFLELGPLLGKEVRCIGPPFALYHSWSGDEMDMDVGFPVAGKGVTKGKVRPIELPAVRAAVTMHVGPYETISETYTKMMAWMSEKGYKPLDYMWEEYLNGPQDTPPEKLMTRLIWPIK